MERIDDDEAHELAAKWLNTIKSNVGLNNDCTSYADANRDSCKQVQQNCDVTCEKRYRCKEGCCAREPTCFEFAKPNAKGCGAMSFKSPDEQQNSEAKQFLGGHALIHDNVRVAATSRCNYASSLISNNQQTNGHTDNGDKEKGVCRLECATSNELFDIWGFDEEQRKQANHYLLDKADEGSIMHEKENIPLLDKSCHADGLFDMDTLRRGRLENVDIKLNSKTTPIPAMTNIKGDYAVSGSNGKYPFEEEHWNQEDEETQRLLVRCKEKLCKVCPGCSEVNLQNANWCEECGKALVTVEITRSSNALQTDLLRSALPLDIAKQTVNSNKISSSKLNPNSAEFVSAFAKPVQVTHSLDNDFLVRYDTVTGNEIISGTGGEYNGSNSCMPDPVSSCNLESSKICRRNTRKLEQQHSANLTDVMKFSRKRDKNVRKWKDDIQRERSYSSDKIPSTCSQYFYSCSSEQAPKGYISSVNPRGEQSLYYQSPSSNPESLGYNQASHTFGAQSQRQRSASWCNVTQNSPCGTLLQMSYSHVGNVDIHRRVHRPFNDEFQRFDAPAVYQGFDFQNPAIENSSLGQCNSFDEAQFSRDLVQSQLNNQIALHYGNWEAPPAHCIGSTDNGMYYQPPVAYPQHVSQNRNLQSWRMYKKKKVVDSFIDSPRTPRSVTRKSMHHAKIKKTDKQNGYSELKAKVHHSKQENEKGNSAGAYQHEEPVVQLHPPVPPLALEDLDVYDQVLSLIRTAREEALPYLCLPEEIVLYIFSFLSKSDISKCARVCRQFRRISMDESLWKEIIIRKRNDLDDEILAKIAQKAPVSLTITQCHSNKVTEVGLRNLFRSCGENLQDVDFSSCSGKALVGELILLQLTFRCRKLRSLDISWSNVSDIGIQAFAENVEQLECLCMNGCQTITDETTRTIARKHTKSVRVIEMFGCFNITHVSLLILQQFCPNIETLNVGQCHKITDASVSEFAKKAQGLENIDLRGCIQIKDTAIKDLASNCLNLSTLVIANCPLITDASMIAIAANIPLIRCLDVCGCPKISERGIQALAKSCSRLEIIDLSSTKATDKAVSSLANYCYQTLESVKLSFCHNVTETSLEQLAKKCNRLSSLHLYGCKRVKNLKRVQDCRRALKIES